MAKNIVKLDYASNPDLKEFFARKNAGDKVEMKIVFTVGETSEESVTGSLTSVELPDEDTGGMTDETDENVPKMGGKTMMTGEEPAAMMLRSAKNA